MPTDAEYEARIAQVDHSGLQEMLAAISRSDSLSGWDAGKALEYLVLRQFQIDGAEVTWPFQLTLEGEVAEQIDGAVYDRGIAWLVECKDWAERVDIEPIAKLRNQLLRRPPGTLGMLFARSGYTGPAKVLARYMTPLCVLLWEFAELEFAVAEQKMRGGLFTKYRFAVEKGMPDYNILGD